MAHLVEPLPDPIYQCRFVEVQLRQSPDLPEHVLGQIQWLSFSEYPGYYLWDPEGQTNNPVEFIENYWYYIYRYDRDTYLSHADRIERYSNNTGYWRITDPEHPEHIPEELPPVPGPSTLTVPRAHAETLESVELSPFQSAPNPDYDQEDQEDQEDKYYEPQTSTTEQATDVLAAQFQHVLDLEDREPENPLTPQVPAYLQLVEQAVEAGLNVPSPPPLAEPEPELQGVVLPEEPEVQVAPIQVPVVFAQPVVQPIMAQQGQAQPQQAAQQQAPAQQAAQVVAPVATTDKLRGSPPDTFKGNRRLFLHQFNLYWGLNENYEVMQIPYFHAMYALSLIRGPNIDDWVNDQVLSIRESTTRVQNPLDRIDPQIWNDFNTAFTNAYTDTAKKQTTYQKLMALKMFKDDLDSYISTFNNLCKQANYDCAAEGTMHIFAQGLKPSLLQAILYGQGAIPNTIIQWEDTARDEMKKHAYRQTMLNLGQAHFKWQFTQSNGNGCHRNKYVHPNDRTVPMDVDPPVFTQVNRAYTDDDKRKHCSEGRCFNCSRIGHISKECPMHKSQTFQFKQSNQPRPRTGYQSTPHKSNQPRKFKCTFPKPTKLGAPSQSYARSAHIEEINEEDKEDIPELAVQAAKFNEGQREQWVDEMKSLGINFRKPNTHSHVAGYLFSGCIRSQMSTNQSSSFPTVCISSHRSSSIIRLRCN